MKKAGVLGTGMVGSVIGKKLITLGYQVKMGSRTASNEKAVEWSSQHGDNASHGTFDDAAAFAEVLFLCTKGLHSLDVIKTIEKKNLKGKIIIDISNPLDFSKGMPPFLSEQFSNTNSLGEEIQKAVPEAHVVKTLNIVNCEVMVDPSRSGGEPSMFVSGNDDTAKQSVKEILAQFGWKDIIDLGDISTARGTEMMLPIWIRTWVATKNGHIAFKVLR
jgi:8-hydroxy-5-deazaflavin:NADPH oxidoreductase